MKSWICLKNFPSQLVKKDKGHFLLKCIVQFFQINQIVNSSLNVSSHKLTLQVHISFHTHGFLAVGNILPRVSLVASSMNLFFLWTYLIILRSNGTSLSLFCFTFRLKTPSSRFFSNVVFIWNPSKSCSTCCTRFLLMKFSIFRSSEL